MHSRAVVPEKERLSRLYRAFHEVIRTAHQLFIDILHANLRRRIHSGIRWQRAPIDDRLLANPTPAGVSSGIILIACLGVQNVAWSELPAEFGALRIVGLVRLLH